MYVCMNVCMYVCMYVLHPFSSKQVGYRKLKSTVAESFSPFATGRAAEGTGSIWTAAEGQTTEESQRTHKLNVISTPQILPPDADQDYIEVTKEMARVGIGSHTYMHLTLTFLSPLPPYLPFPSSTTVCRTHLMRLPCCRVYWGPTAPTWTLRVSIFLLSSVPSPGDTKRCLGWVGGWMSKWGGCVWVSGWVSGDS